jgi:glycosyltransferase involved in cell wall biosynthesis
MFRQGHQQRLLISAVIPALHEAKNLPYVLPSLLPIVSEAVLVDGHATDDAINVARQALPALHIVKQA